MVNLKELTIENLDRLAKECGINLKGQKKAEKIEEIKNAGIEPAKLEEVFKKYAPKCIICGMKGPLDDVLWYCEACNRYYCINCAEKRETNDCYASYVKTYFKCRKGHYIGKDWI